MSTHPRRHPRGNVSGNTISGEKLFEISFKFENKGVITP